MSAPWLSLLSQDVSDYEEPSATVLVPNNGAMTSILKVNVRPYQKVAIVSHAQAWDAPGNGFISYGLKVSGGYQYPYESRTAVISAPFGDTIYLPKPLWIPQLTTVEVVAICAAGASTSVNFTEKLVIFYFNQDPNLRRLQSQRVGDVPLQGVSHGRSH